MQHILAVAGTGIVALGTAALSFDLLRTKSAEQSLSEFKRLQDETDLAAQELIMRVNSGFATLSKFLAGYLSLQEMSAQFQQEATEGKKGVNDSDPDTEKLRNLIMDHSEKGIGHLVAARFAEAQENLASEQEVKKALNLITMTREGVQRRFAEEVIRSDKMKRVATLGVVLVGTGTLCQLVDFFLS